MSSKEVRDAAGEAPAKDRSAADLLKEKRQALRAAHDRYAVAKASRDEREMSEESRLAASLVVLITECSKPGVGGCTRTSPQGRWLAADLAAHPNRCTQAYWHRPRWQDNGRTNSASSYFVEALYEAGAEVVLTGHEHLYERFAPQTPSGVANPNGIRQFIVGTGGKSRHGLSRTPAPQRRGPHRQRLRGADPDAAPRQLRLAVRVRGGPDLHRLGKPPLPLTLSSLGISSQASAPPWWLAAPSSRTCGSTQPSRRCANSRTRPRP
jgi:hypothetical protein